MKLTLAENLDLAWGRYIALAITVLTLPSILQWSKIPIDGSFLWLALYTLILLCFLKLKTEFYDISNDKNIRFVLLYLSWNIVCIIRGTTVASNYWEWKNLVGTSLVLLLPISIYAFTNTLVVQLILKYWIKFALPAFFLFLPFFTDGDALGRYLVPISFMALFLPLLTKKWKIIVLCFSAIVIIGALDARSSVIKFSICIVFSLIYYARNIISLKIIRFARIFLLFIPILLFYLGSAGIFNIFNIDDYYKADLSTTVNKKGTAEHEDLKADTRTGLYEEVLTSALKHDYVWLGRTPARGNESQLFGEVLAEQLKTGKMERFSNEVSVLNIFTWTGTIGVILYFLLFFQASYLAIIKSNSLTMRIIGLFVAFRWLYAWIEDFSDFDLSFIILWLLIGMCYSNSFRKMNDNQFKYWIRAILN
ncbi:MAG: hypothetical protein EOP00_20515 [Pedobacter sp.]|nr:MAG: hypothetical protein EOP00_20515 [Pedobacter sp.]